MHMLTIKIYLLQARIRMSLLRFEDCLEVQVHAAESYLSGMGPAGTHDCTDFARQQDSLMSSLSSLMHVLDLLSEGWTCRIFDCLTVSTRASKHHR